MDVGPEMGPAGRPSGRGAKAGAGVEERSKEILGTPWGLLCNCKKLYGYPRDGSQKSGPLY